MNVAITGGTGFIGKRLVANLLQRGCTVKVLSRSASSPLNSPLMKVYPCDLVTIGIDELSIMLDDVDVIYHCAGQLSNTRAMRPLHVEATRKLAEAASKRIAHWVQLSSVGVYGPVAKGVVTENSILSPIGEYEITKAESDQIVIDAANKVGFTFSILRPSNVFGAGMTNHSLFSMISMIDRGLFLYIGKPGASANYIHVNNVVEGLMSCGSMQLAKNSIYNLSDCWTMEHFVEVIAAELGRVSFYAPRIPKPIAQIVGMTLGRLPRFPLTQSRVDALTNRANYPIALIKHELGYRNVMSMEDGLRELVGVYKLQFRH